MASVLTKIVADKANWLVQRKQCQPLAQFHGQLEPSSRDFYQALRGGCTAFILECKKASPSKGVIRAGFDPVAIAGVYKHYASVISVLTDEKYFQGDYAFLHQVSQSVSQPVLCKDFIIDPYQIYLARYYQADACLLMLSVLDDQQYRELAALAHNLHMGVLTEVSNEQELERALHLQARVVGINNRDLRDLSIDLNRTRQFAPQFPASVTLISESGIHHHHQVRELSQFVSGFLIGSALMEHEDLHRAVRHIIFGDNKVCGLTRPQDAWIAWQVGAVYGGLIFVASSPRAITISQAQQIITSAPLRYVAVVRNAPLAQVLEISHRLPLHAIQLHGSEDQAYITQLRECLNPAVAIWKALSVGSTLPVRNLQHVARYLLDNGQGGSGQCFDWSLLNGQARDNCLLAGGITADNCARAAGYGCAGLDFNSGVESMAGVKDLAKLAEAFRVLRAY